MALRRKGVEIDTFCPVCNLVEETDMHCLLDCPMAVDCWQRAGNGYVRVWNVDQCRMALMICWALWKNR